MHDWTLVFINVAWERATVEVGLLDASGQRTLLLKGVTAVSFDRSEPWGASNSVNAVSVVDDPSGRGVVLALELQSGDNVMFSASSCELDGARYPG